jgi:hypothetical protein
LNVVVLRSLLLPLVLLPVFHLLMLESIKLLEPMYVSKLSKRVRNVLLPLVVFVFL